MTGKGKGVREKVKEREEERDEPKESGMRRGRDGKGKEGREAGPSRKEKEQ